MTEAQAFPLTLSKDWEEHIPGMSLRDYFAGQALIALINRNNIHDLEMVAENAYVYADAMMTERGD